MDRQDIAAAARALNLLDDFIAANGTADSRLREARDLLSGVLDKPAIRSALRCEFCGLTHKKCDKNSCYCGDDPCAVKGEGFNEKCFAFWEAK